MSSGFCELMIPERNSGKRRRKSSSYVSKDTFVALYILIIISQIQRIIGSLMESNTIREIEAKAGEKKLFTRFNVEDLDTYMTLILKMKVQTDNLYEGNQRALRDIAILYKRV